MPFKDADAARAYQRERKRAERAAAVHPTVQPAVAAPPPTREELRLAGAILNCARSDGEADDAYRDRLRAAWQSLLSVAA